MPEQARLQARLRTAFVVVILAAAVFVVWSAADFRTAARLFPQYAGGATILLCLVELARQFVRRNILTDDAATNTADLGLDAEERTGRGMARSLAVYGWVVAYLALIHLLGAAYATALFVPALLHLRFRSDWRATLGIVVGLIVLMWVLRLALNLRLPPGLLGLPF